MLHSALATAVVALRHGRSGARVAMVGGVGRARSRHRVPGAAVPGRVPAEDAREEPVPRALLPDDARARRVRDGNDVHVPVGGGVRPQGAGGARRHGVVPRHPLDRRLVRVAGRRVPLAATARAALRAIAARAPARVFVATAAPDNVPFGLVTRRDVECVLSPRHATILLVIGRIPAAWLDALWRVHDEMPEYVRRLASFRRPQP